VGRALLTTLATLLLIGVTALLLRGMVGGPDIPSARALEALNPDALGTALRLVVWGLLGVLLLLLILRVAVALTFLFGVGYAPLAYLGQALLLPVVRKTAGGLTAGIMLSTQIAGGGAGAAAAASARGSGPAPVAAVTTLHGPPKASGHAGGGRGAGGPDAAPVAHTTMAHASRSPSGTAARGGTATRRLLGGKGWRRDGALTYTVQPGDSLSLITRRFYGDLLAYPRLYRANRGRPQPHGRRLIDPWRIEPGWTILVPLPSPVVTLPEPGTLTYVVQPGDTLVTIAASLLGNWQRYTELVALNTGQEQADGARLGDPSMIRVGWVLRLPAEGVQAPLARGGGARTTPTGELRAATPRQRRHRRAVVAHARLHRSGQVQSPARPAARPPRVAHPSPVPPPVRALRILPPLHITSGPRRAVGRGAVRPPAPGARPGTREEPAMGRDPAAPAPPAPRVGSSPRLARPRSTPRTAPTVLLPDGRLLPTSLAATFLALLAVVGWRRRRRGGTPTLVRVGWGDSRVEEHGERGGTGLLARQRAVSCPDKEILSWYAGGHCDIPIARPKKGLACILRLPPPLSALPLHPGAATLPDWPV